MITEGKYLDLSLRENLTADYELHMHRTAFTWDYKNTVTGKTNCTDAGGTSGDPATLFGSQFFCRTLFGGAYFLMKQSTIFAHKI